MKWKKNNEGKEEEENEEEDVTTERQLVNEIQCRRYLELSVYDSGACLSWDCLD